MNLYIFTAIYINRNKFINKIREEFIDNESKKIFYKKIGQAKNVGIYAKSLIYLLANNKEAREYFNDIYNIKENEVNSHIFDLPWQTDMSLNICRLAYNLFRDLTSGNVEEEANFTYSVSSIFKNIDVNLGVQAIKLRFLEKRLDK